jgi:hypothetical protein
MDAAAYAAMSDPDRNPNFRRKWDAPPLKPKRPPMGGTIGQAEIEKQSSKRSLHIPATIPGQSFSERLRAEAHAWRSARARIGEA